MSTFTASAFFPSPSDVSDIYLDIRKIKDLARGRATRAGQDPGLLDYLTRMDQAVRRAEQVVLDFASVTRVRAVRPARPDDGTLRDKPGEELS